MATPLPIYAETIRGYVMHDLGMLAASRKSPPQLSDARKLTAARTASFGAGGGIIEQIAQQSIRDWRASTRAGEMGPLSPVSAAYLKDAPSSGVIGIRVILTITYPGPTPPGAKTTASLLLNVAPNASLGNIQALALSAWNSHTVQTPHGGRSGGKAVSADIVQVVEGGFAQAQI